MKPAWYAIRSPEPFVCALDAQAPLDVTTALQEGRRRRRAWPIAHRVTRFMALRARGSPQEVDEGGTARLAIRSLSHVLAQDMHLHTTKEAT